MDWAERGSRRHEVGKMDLSSGFLSSESPSFDGGASEHSSELDFYSSYERRRTIYLIR